MDFKKTIAITAACLALCGAGHANAETNEMTIGYCLGELPAKGDISFAESDAWVSGAIYIPAGMLSTYSGNRLTGVNAGLASKLNIDELKVWLREDLNGENLVENTINSTTDQKIAKGWNAISFEEAWTVPDKVEKGVYIGYSFHQKGTAFGVAAIPTPLPNAYYVKFGEGEWEDRCGQGAICVEGFMTGDNLPQVNMTILSIACDPTYIIEKGKIGVQGTVKNNGVLTVTGYDVSAEVDGKRVGTVHVDCSIENNASGSFDVDVPLDITAVGDGTGKMTVVIDGIKEGTDADMTDNQAVLSFGIVERDFTRRIFVEEFTGEACPNCPRVANYMHESLAKEAFSENVFAICHHAGYEVDWLTTNFDYEYTKLYNGSTYAPGMAVDRYLIEKNSAVWCPLSVNDMESKWREALARPAFVSVNVKATIDGANPDVISVTVDGMKSKEELCADPRITVFVVEDNIKSRRQAGADGEWIHQHVGRAVNAKWGDPIEFDGNDYKYECEFTMSPGWKREDLQLIAIVANYNPDNILDNQVENASGLRYADFNMVGVGTIDADENAEAELYTLTGVRVNADEAAPGIYVRRQGSKTEKIIVK